MHIWARHPVNRNRIFPLSSKFIQEYRTGKNISVILYRNTGQGFIYRNRACKQGFFTGQGFTIKDNKLPKLLMSDKQAVVSFMVLLFSLLIPVFLYNFYRKTGCPLFEPGFSLFNPCIPVKF